MKTLVQFLCFETLEWIVDLFAVHLPGTMYMQMLSIFIVQKAMISA